jgi:hypothetical protein
LFTWLADGYRDRQNPNRACHPLAGDRAAARCTNNIIRRRALFQESNLKVHTIWPASEVTAPIEAPFIR